MIVKYYVKYLEFFVDRISRVLRVSLFQKSPRAVEIATTYFYITSRITYFFLFTRIAYYGFWAVFSYVFYTNGDNFNRIYYTALHEGWSTFFFNFFHFLDWNFWIFIGFLSLLVELAFNNTVLISVPEVETEIKKRYGEDFPKSVGYNSRATTLLRSVEKLSTPLLGIAIAFTGSTVGQVVESNNHAGNYREYLNTQKECPDVKFEAPSRPSWFKFK